MESAGSCVRAGWTESCPAGQYWRVPGSVELTGSLRVSRLNYTDNENMEWIIGAITGETTTVVFTTFETEACCDSVLVYSCADASCSPDTVTALVQLRGALDLPYAVTSLTGVVKVVWRSDASNASAAYRDSGWSATRTARSSHGDPAAGNCTPCDSCPSGHERAGCGQLSAGSCVQSNICPAGEYLSEPSPAGVASTGSLSRLN